MTGAADSSQFVAIELVNRMGKDLQGMDNERRTYGIGLPKVTFLLLL